MKRKQRTPGQILGRILQEIRDEAELTQEAVAKHLKYANAASISHIERGVRTLRFWEFVEFCRLCEQDPMEIFAEVMKEVPGSFFPPEE